MSFTWGCAFPQNIFKNLTGKHFKFSEFLRNFAKNFAIFKNPFFTEHLRTPAAVSCKDCRIYAEIKHFLSYFFLSKCHIRVAVFLWQSRNFQKQPPEVICRPQPLTLLKQIFLQDTSSLLLVNSFPCDSSMSFWLTTIHKAAGTFLCCLFFPISY